MEVRPNRPIGCTLAMPEPHYQIQYVATLDEAIEITILSTQRSQTHRRAKQRGRRNLALLAVALPTAIGSIDELLEWRVAGLIALGSALLLGLPAYFLYGLYYDRVIRIRSAKLVRETWGDTASTPSETEFLDDKLWAKQRNLEICLPWNSLLEIEDADEAVRLWFIHTEVTFPRRAFKSDEDRAKLLETARTLAERAGAPAFAHSRPG